MKQLSISAVINTDNILVVMAVSGGSKHFVWGARGAEVERRMVLFYFYLIDDWTGCSSFQLVVVPASARVKAGMSPLPGGR